MIGGGTGAVGGAISGYQSGSASTSIGQAWKTGWTSGSTTGQAAGNAAGTTIRNGGSIKEAENAAILASAQEAHRQRIQLEEEATTIEQELQALGIDTTTTTGMTLEQRVRYLREYKRICDELSANEKFDPTKANEKIKEFIIEDQKSWWDKHWDEVVAGTLIIGGGLAFILVTGGLGIPGLIIGGVFYSGATIAGWGVITGLVTIAVSGGVWGAANHAYNNGDITAEERNTLVSGAQKGIGLSVTAIIIAGVHYAFEQFSDVTNKGNSELEKNVKVGNWTYSDNAYKGDRAYQDSPNTIQSIINSGPPEMDPRGSNGLWWKVEGNFNGSSGTYELLLSPDEKTIWHFLFRSDK